MSRCQWPEGMEIRPDGVHRLDPCTYDVIEEHRDVTVRVLRCSRCGHQESEWEDTGRWIPVSERLPKYDQRALVWSDYYYIAAYWPDGPAGDEKPWFNPAIGFFAAEAWMPLPEPYREEDHG